MHKNLVNTLAITVIFCSLSIAFAAEKSETVSLPVPYKFLGGERVRLLVPSSIGESIEQLVSDDGFISLPIGGTLNIKGKTILEAHELLKNALKEESTTKRVFGAIAILDIPPRRVFVTGEVRTPQAVVLTPGQKMSVAAAIAVAGGPTPEADLSRIRLAHCDCNGKCTAYDLSQIEVKEFAELGPALEPGDVIYVPRTEVFMLAGEVSTPGAYTRRQLSILPGESVRFSRVLMGAGGLRATANRSDLRLVRTGSDGAQSIVSVSLDRALNATTRGKSGSPVNADDDPILRNGDVIVANATGGISIFGQLTRPGVYPTGGQPMKLSRLIALAGGFTQFAKSSGVSVIRASNPGVTLKVDVNAITKDGGADRDILLEDGDMVFVGERML
jgi:polysaccharide biosynthesis/export protein